MTLNSDRRIMIYGLADPRTGAVRYVGKSVHPRKRLSQHIKDSHRPVEARENSHLSYWLLQLEAAGLRAHLKILEECEWSSWEERERYWIAEFRKLGNLCNVLDGGNAPPSRKGTKYTPEQLAHASEKFTPEVRLRMRLAHLGHKHTPEQTAKIGAANKGRRRSSETRKKMSEIAIRLGWRPALRYRAVDLLGDFGLPIIRFDSMVEAGSELGIHNKGIWNVVAGRAHTVGGFALQYAAAT